MVADGVPICDHCWKPSANVECSYDAPPVLTEIIGRDSMSVNKLSSQPAIERKTLWMRLKSIFNR